MLGAVDEGVNFKDAYGPGNVPAAGAAGHCSACFSGEYPIKHDKMF